MDAAALRRLFSHVAPDSESGCWLWTAYIDRKGYGRIGYLGGVSLAHRISYLLIKGSIPNGLTLDHLCRVRHCVNPDHLEPVTAAENTRRGNNAIKTHCRNGHPYNEENTYRWNGRRACRICNAAAVARYSERVR